MLKTRLVLPVLTGAIGLTSCIVTADTFTEDFATDPLARGWQVYGNTNLFVWNPTNQTLEVTWDSSESNSYFYRSLGTILTLADEFELAFDIKLENADVTGWGFELAVGFMNVESATSPNFLRGTGMNSPDLFEFDYFPDAGFGPSITATMADSNSRLSFWWASVPLELGVQYRIRLYHAAGTTNIAAVVLVDGQVYTSLPYSWVSTNFTDFRLNAISISSYSDESSGGAILAHGLVDNLVVTIPSPPVANLSCGFDAGTWQMQFQSQTNWVYALERTRDFITWTDVSPNVAGTGAVLSLQDTNPPVDHAFYRVRAYRP